MLYNLPKGHAGMLVLTHCDAANNQFVDLAAWSFKTEAELAAAWESVPESKLETPYLLDHHTGQGMDNNKYVGTEWIEARTGKKLAELITTGRTETNQWLADAGILKPGKTAFAHAAI